MRVKELAEQVITKDLLIKAIPYYEVENVYNIGRKHHGCP